MTAARRTGAESSKTRAVLLDVTERLMRDEGYAAVSSRRVASEAGVTGALVHYYFPTLDDLFLAVFRRGAQRNLDRHARALASPQPLRALWEFSVEPAGTTLFIEFMALANHRKSIRREIASYAKRFRRLQVEALTTRLQEHGIDPDELPPDVLRALVAALSRNLVMEEALGITAGHAETRAFVEQWLERLEGAATTAARRPPTRTRSQPAKG